MSKGRKTGGRRKGVLNKVTADVKIAAQKYTTSALSTLASIMHDSEQDAARVAAAKELLDRGHGRARQPIDATITESMVARMPEKSPDADEWVGTHGPH